MHNMVTALLLVMCFLAANATEIGCRMWLVEMEIGQLTKFPIETNHRGFSGSGFVNHENDSSEAVFFVNTDLGSGPLGIRYAAGTDDRFMMVSVNGFSQQVRFPSTGSWTNWETVKTQDFLWKQGNNEFKIYAVPGKNGPNLDSFSVCITELPPRQLGETCGSCFCPPTFTAGECAEGLVCEHSSMFEDLPGNCVEDRPVYVKHEKSQCNSNFAFYRGDRFDNPIFNGASSIGQMTGSECEAECTNPANVDSRGRPCVAFEHSSQDYDAVANCALAWACDYTTPWHGGASYIRVSLPTTSPSALPSMSPSTDEPSMSPSADEPSVSPTNEPTGCVTIFQHGDFSGTSVSLNIGEYNLLDLGDLGNDEASSMIVGHACKITLFADGHFKGEHVTFTPGSYGIDAFTSTIGNDKLSSCIVEATEYIKHEKSQCQANFAPYNGDRLDNPIFNGGGFIGQMTGSECAAECTNPANVDGFGRPCVAFEHSSQDYDAVANCALAWACDYTEKWSGGAAYIRAHMNLPSDYAMAASDVCVSAVDVDGTLFDVLYTGNVDSTKLVHTSGRVTCNVNTPNRYSNWGCTPGDQNLAIRLLADDAQTRKFPSSGTEGLTENTEVGTWYKLEGHDSSSDSLTIHGPSQTILHRYRAVYSDALTSNHDNGGEVCFDVFMKASAAFVKHGHSQCVSNNAPFDGDRLDNPIFGGGGFIGKMTGAECEAQCIDPTNVDEHGRPCVAFEHSHSQYTAVANCALAWACDYTKAWSGGTVYSRAHRN